MEFCSEWTCRHPAYCCSLWPAVAKGCKAPGGSLVACLLDARVWCVWERAAHAFCLVNFLDRLLVQVGPALSPAKARQRYPPGVGVGAIHTLPVSMKLMLTALSAASCAFCAAF